MTINELFVLTILAVVGKCLTSLQISNRTAITQPDVLMALQSLVNKGFVRQCGNALPNGMNSGEIAKETRELPDGMNSGEIIKEDHDLPDDMKHPQKIPIITTWCITKNGENHIKQLNSEMDDS